MTLFGVVFLLEAYPMVTLIRWRARRGRQQPVDVSVAPLLARLSRLEIALIAAIPFAASAMVRGIGFGWSPL